MDEDTAPGAADRLTVADAAYRELRLDEAASAYRDALALRPDSYEAQLGLARTLTRQRRREEAYAAAERLVGLDAGRFEGHTALGTLHFLTDRYDEALESLRRAVDLAPQEPEPHLTLAQVHADRADYDRAHDEIRAAREGVATIADDDERRAMEAFALHVETYVLLAEGRSAEATEAAQRVIAMEDANPHAAALAYANLGILEAQARNLDRAIEYLERAYEMNPFFHRAGGALGRILYVRGEFERAAQVLEGVVERMPERDASTHYVYGMALAKTGRQAAARDQFRLALEGNLRGPDRLLARWQILWQNPAGRYAVIAVLLVLAAAWLLVLRPDPQSLALVAVFVVLFLGQRYLRRRRR